MATPPAAIAMGAAINGVNLDPVTYLLHQIANRYSELEDERTMTMGRAIIDFMRRPNERIDDILTRWDLARANAASVGADLYEVYQMSHGNVNSDGKASCPHSSRRSSASSCCSDPMCHGDVNSEADEEFILMIEEDDDDDKCEPAWKKATWWQSQQAQSSSYQPYDKKTSWQTVPDKEASWQAVPDKETPWQPAPSRQETYGRQSHRDSGEPASTASSSAVPSDVLPKAKKSRRGSCKTREENRSDQALKLERKDAAS